MAGKFLLNMRLYHMSGHDIGSLVRSFSDLWDSNFMFWVVSVGDIK